MILHIIWDVVRCSLCFSTGYVLLTLRYPNVDSPVSLGFSWFLEDVERERILFQRSVKSEKNKITLNRVWLHNPYLMHSTSSTNSFQILAQDSENISVVWYLQRVTLRCCGVHGYYLDFLFLIYEMRALFCCGSTRSIFTLHLSICLFFKKKKKKKRRPPPALRIYNPVVFLGSVLMTEKKKEPTECGGLSSASMPSYPTSFYQPVLPAP